MFNIIKMDLYKMFKSRSFYILNIALIVIILTVGIVMKVQVSMDYEKAQESNVSWSGEDSLKSDDPLLTEEGYYQMQEESINGLDVKEFMTIQYSGITLILLALFIAILVCSELETGFIKNIIPLKNSRTSLIISKSIVSLIFILIQTAIGFAASALSTIILSGQINILHPKGLAVYLGLQIILSMAFASLVILISYLTKSKAAVMSIGILLSLNIQGLVLGVLDKLMNLSKINISQLSIINNARMGMFDKTDYKRVIIISIVYFILYNIISTIRVRRMEID